MESGDVTLHNKQSFPSLFNLFRSRIALFFRYPSQNTVVLFILLFHTKDVDFPCAFITSFKYQFLILNHMQVFPEFMCYMREESKRNHSIVRVGWRWHYIYFHQDMTYWHRVERKEETKYKRFPPICREISYFPFPAFKDGYYWLETIWIFFLKKQGWRSTDTCSSK